MSRTDLTAWIPGHLTNPLNGAHGHWSVKAKQRKGWRERAFLCCTDAMTRSGYRPHADSPKLIVLTACETRRLRARWGAPRAPK